MSFVKAAALEELWCGEMQAATVAGRRVLLVHLPGCVRAYEDRCAHLGVPLSEGSLDGEVLTCRAHGWSYDARTGCGLNPANSKLSPVAVRVDGDDVLVDPLAAPEAP